MVLTVLKPVRITHLTVSLHGYVRVYKNANGAGSESPINPAEVASRGVSSFKYLGNGFASLFEDEQVLSADGRLDAGRYEFNFDLMFPSKGLPSSIDVGLRPPPSVAIDFFVYKSPNILPLHSLNEVPFHI